MNVRNCVKCGKIFNYIAGVPMCPSCKSELEERFQVTKRYIRDNPHSNIAEISEACDVSVKMIHQWVREERLIFAEDSPIGISCELCDTSIRTGRFCDACKADIQHSLGGAYANPEAIEKLKKTRNKKEEMRFLNRDRD